MTFAAVSPVKIERPPIRRGLTFWLFLPTVVLAVTSFVAFCSGAIPWWLNWALIAPLYYFLIICSHDALHCSAHRTTDRDFNPLQNNILASIFATGSVI